MAGSRHSGRAWRAWLWLSFPLYAGCSGSAAPSTPAPAPALVVSSAPAGFPGGSNVELSPSDNALTEARAQLGKRLFYDHRLSRTNEVACANCHRQAQAFSDPDSVSSGIQQRKGTRNAPALLNMAWGESFFWDGRAHTLEEQAGQPIENPLEMDLSLTEAVARITADASYVAAFQEAYGEPPSQASLRKALASFVRTLVSESSPYDRHLRGDDSSFGAAELGGEALFLSDKAGCFHCHPAGVLSNEGFFNNGTFVAGGDAGRQALTGRAGDLGKFKVPGLRNIENSAPYMHDGSLPTLEAVIDQYDRGGRGDPTTDPQIVPLGLSEQEKADLLAFLRSLTDPGLLSDPRYAP